MAFDLRRQRFLNSRGYNRDVIEAALGHQDEDEIRRIYNRSKYWPERVKLMNEWAVIVEELARNERTVVKASGVAGIQSWLSKSAQRDKWIFCLTAARLAANQESK